MKISYIKINENRKISICKIFSQKSKYLKIKSSENEIVHFDRRLNIAIEDTSCLWVNCPDTVCLALILLSYHTEINLYL